MRSHNLNRYGVDNFIMMLMQLERVKSGSPRLSYEFYKISGIISILKIHFLLLIQIFSRAVDGGHHF